MSTWVSSTNAKQPELLGGGGGGGEVGQWWAESVATAAEVSVVMAAVPLPVGVALSIAAVESDKKRHKRRWPHSPEHRQKQKHYWKQASLHWLPPICKGGTLETSSSSSWWPKRGGGGRGYYWWSSGFHSIQIRLSPSPPINKPASKSSWGRGGGTGATKRVGETPFASDTVSTIRAFVGK